MIEKLFLAMLFIASGMMGVKAQSIGDKISSLIPTGENVYRHGYNELDDEGKALYNSIVESLCHFNTKEKYLNIQYRCDLTGVPTSRSIYTVMTDLNRIIHDMPEMYILSTYIPRQDEVTRMFYARIGIVNTPEKYLEELEKLNEIADKILEPVKDGMSDYEKLKIIHDGFINWGDYGDMTGADAGNIRGALINKKAVCEGFARAGLFLCQRAGLKCIYIEGQLRTSSVNNEWGNHAWNFVEVDGKWYLMDLTTDGGFAGVCGYSAFLRGQDYFSENYKLMSKNGSSGEIDNNSMYKFIPSLEAITYNPTASIVEVEDKGRKAKTIKYHDDKSRLIIQKNSHLYDALGRKIDK